MKKGIVFAIVAMILLSVWYFDLGHYLSFEKVTGYIHSAQEAYKNNTVLFMILYFFFYIIIATLPIPGEMTTTLFGGIIMGLWPALILVSFASTIGACLAMLLARYLFRDFIQEKFQTIYAKVQKGFYEDGIYYVLMLRVLPIPFFIVNIMLGLVPVSFRTFYIASQIGMFPATFLVAKTGAELGLVESPKDIFTLEIIALLIAMAVFPLVAKKTILFFTKKKEEELQF